MHTLARGTCMLLVAVVAACDARDTVAPPLDRGAPAGGPVDSAPDTTPDTADPAPPDTGAQDDGPGGVRLDPPLDPPDFLVENQHRAPRTPDWFVGDPSVLWFFRDAGST